MGGINGRRDQTHERLIQCQLYDPTPQKRLCRYEGEYEGYLLLLNSTLKKKIGYFRSIYCSCVTEQTDFSSYTTYIIKAMK